MFTERRFGKPAVERCIRELAPADQEVLLSIVPLGWFPLEPTARFGVAVDKLYGRGDLELCREIGRFSAEWQLNLFHKLVLRFKPAEWLFVRGMSVWQQYHDTGRWEVERPGENHVIARLRDFAVAEPGWCARFGGFIQRAAEVTGARNVEVQHPRCRVLGEPCCEYEGRWI